MQAPTSATGHTGLYRDAATQGHHIKTGIVTASPGFTETQKVKMRRQRNLFQMEEQEKKKNPDKTTNETEIIYQTKSLKQE